MDRRVATIAIGTCVLMVMGAASVVVYQWTDTGLTFGDTRPVFADVPTQLSASTPFAAVDLACPSPILPQSAMVHAPPFGASKRKSDVVCGCPIGEPAASTANVDLSFLEFTDRDPLSGPNWRNAPPADAPVRLSSHMWLPEDSDSADYSAHAWPELDAMLWHAHHFGADGFSTMKPDVTIIQRSRFGVDPRPDKAAEQK